MQHNHHPLPLINPKNRPSSLLSPPLSLLLCLPLSLVKALTRGSLAKLHCCVSRPYKSRELTSGLKILCLSLTSSQWKPWEHHIVPPVASNSGGSKCFQYVQKSAHVCTCRLPLAFPPPAMRPAALRNLWMEPPESASPIAPGHRTDGVGSLNAVKQRTVTSDNYMASVLLIREVRNYWNEYKNC